MQEDQLQQIQQERMQVDQQRLLLKIQIAQDLQQVMRQDQLSRDHPLLQVD